MGIASLENGASSHGACDAPRAIISALSSTSAGRSGSAFKEGADSAKAYAPLAARSTARSAAS